MRGKSRERCHKSYMVNINFIAGYETYKFLLKNSEKVSIPPKKYAEMIPPVDEQK